MTEKGITELKIPMDGLNARIENDTIIISFDEKWHAISSAIVGGGFLRPSHIINLHVRKNYHNDSPELDIQKALGDLCLDGDVAGMMTAADLRNISIISEEDEEIRVVAIVTGGVSNAATCGEDGIRRIVGTINIVLLIDGDLSKSAMVGSVKTATEAKTLALHDLDIRSASSGEMATGTTTDTIVIACTGKGQKIRYSGTATKLGQIIGKVLRKAIKNAIEKQDNLISNRAITQRLGERGITMDDLLNAAMEIFVPHPGLDTKETAAMVFKEELGKSLQDPNITALIMAGLRLEEDGRTNSIPSLKKEDFENDSVNIVADEILGMAIAEYIGGTRARFEYVRFDTKKPGILSKLGPFVDDVICGVIAGISSKMYSDRVH